MNLKVNGVLGAAILASVLIAPTQVSAQGAIICGAPAQCTNVMGQRQCTEMWNYSVVSYTVMTAAATGAATNCSVTGNNSARNFMATRPTTAAATGACNFGGIFDYGGGTNSWVCTINQAGGLPVELMEFNIDEGKVKGGEESSG